MSDLIVLVPSSLGSPGSWQPVADELRRQGMASVICAPTLDENGPEPLWSQQAKAIESALAGLPTSTRLELVGHSGATAILPAAGQLLSGRVAAYVFVDGPIPVDGHSALDTMEAEIPRLYEAVRSALAAGGRFPDAPPQERGGNGTRRQVTASPRGRRFFEEPVTVPAGWPDAPCAYIQTGVDLGPSCGEARRRGWPTRSLHGHHFSLVSDPNSVVDALIEVLAELRGGATGAGAAGEKPDPTYGALTRKGGRNGPW